MRDTSKEAYASVFPRLSDMQAAVLAVLRGSPPLTNAEIADKLGWTINRVTPRCGELRDRGLVSDAGKRPCRITGRNAHIWVYGELPKPKKYEWKPVMVNGVRMVRRVEV